LFTKLTKKEHQLVEYLKSNSYDETSKFFKKSIAQIRDIIKRFNAEQTDEVFKYCDHEFVYIQTIHKIGLEYYGYCKKCGFHTTGIPKDLIRDYPNCLIVEKQISDCNKQGCEFCQQ